MKRTLKTTLIGILLAVSLLATPLAQQVSAVDVIGRSCAGSSSGAGSSAGGATAGSGSPLCDAAKDENETVPALVKNIVNLLLVVLGFISVIMIIIGGIRYTTSNGDANNTKSAKDTILYSVVGLVVAILAYAIVNFVLDFFIGA